MSHKRTEAIVLRRSPHGESDIIIRFLTRDFGKVTAIAKGGKRSIRRFMGGFEPFSHVNLQFYERDVSRIVRVITCEIIDSFIALREDLRKFYTASYMVELADLLLPERERNDAVFELLLNMLRLYAKEVFKPFSLMIFELKMLRLSGYRPVIERCLRCGSRDIYAGRIFFNAAKGGVVCEKCVNEAESLHPIQVETLKVLQDAIRMDPCDLVPDVSESVLYEWAGILKALLIFHTDLSIRSMRFVYPIIDN